MAWKYKKGKKRLWELNRGKMLRILEFRVRELTLNVEFLRLLIGMPNGSDLWTGNVRVEPLENANLDRLTLEQHFNSQALKCRKIDFKSGLRSIRDPLRKLRRSNLFSQRAIFRIFSIARIES